MNREQRRQQKRAEKRNANKPSPAYKSMTKQQKIQALIKNGITIENLKRSYDDGYNAGFADAAPATFKTIYAAICLALNEKYGFGQKRCIDVLNAVDRYVVDSLTSAEAIEEVYKRMKITIDFSEAFDRVVESE